MEVTQVRYGPTFRDPKTQSKLLGKNPLAAHVGTCGAFYDLAGTDGRGGRRTDGRTGRTTAAGRTAAAKVIEWNMQRNRG